MKSSTRLEPAVDRQPAPVQCTRGDHCCAPFAAVPVFVSSTPSVETAASVCVLERNEVSARLVPVATPSTGVISVGDVLSTTATVPVEAVTPVPPFATGNVPVTPVVSGR